MNNFLLKDLDNSGNSFTMFQGWDGDISLTIIDDKGIHHNVRIGIGPNSGDPNQNVEDIEYIKSALRNLMMEFKYQNGEISKEEIERYRNAPKVLSCSKAWFID